MLRHVCFGLALVCAAALAQPIFADPELFSAPYNESPVRGGPGDVVVMAGHGFLAGDRVVYRRLTGCSNSCCQSAPTTIPPTSNANCGEATVAARHDQALSVQLPSAVVANETYALRVFRALAPVTPEVKINDARPRWVSPSRIHISTPVPGVQGTPRYLKVVGRNLQARPGAQSQVRIMSGSTTIAGPLKAIVDSEPAMNHYVAQVNLPATVSCSFPPCNYTVQVSRDGQSWVAAPNTLQVLANPAASVEKNVGDYGCSPDNTDDDTPCVLAAISGAAGQGGTVVFGAGQWLLKGSGAPDGITLPPGVNLKGKGYEVTTVKRHEDWHTPVVFKIERGPNTIEGIHFVDEHALAGLSPSFCVGATNPCTVFVNLSNKLNGQPTTQPIEDVTITNNKFEDISFAALGDRLHEPLSRTVRRLYVTNNVFESYWTAIFLGAWGDPNDGTMMNFDDAIITSNQFHPGEYDEPAIHQGTIATALGAGRRLDFSGNVANERDLNEVPRGWRAAYFWHMANSHEDLLVSKNEGYCTGAVGSDGEFLAFDGNANVSGFPNMVAVTAAGGTSVTVAESPAFEMGYWIQIVDGRGLGQTRKVTSCTPSCSGAGPVTINVSTAWDVTPDTTSRITAARQYWQLYQVANKVDMQACERENPTEPESGRMGFHGTTADSTIEANDQYKSDGIFLGGGYAATGCHQTPGAPEFLCYYDPTGDDPACAGCGGGGFAVLCADADHPEVLFCQAGAVCSEGSNRVCSYPYTQFTYFNEIRGNLINDEYDFDDLRSWSGIDALSGAVPFAPTPTLGYGNIIARNEIIHADATYGGGIALALGWYPGSAGDPHFRSTAVHHNTISGIERTTLGSCNPPHCYNNVGGQLGGGTAIYIQNEHAHDTLLKDNVFTDTCYGVRDFGTGTINYQDSQPLCPSTQACPGPSCSAGGSCTTVNSGLVHCDSSTNVSFNCPCVDPPYAQSTIHQETCPCTGGGCPITQQRLLCQVP